MTTPDQPAAREDYPDALAAVVALRARLVAAVVATLGLPHADAEDVVSAVVVKVLASGHGPDGRATWFTYLRRAVLNEAHDHAARASARAEREVSFVLRRGHDPMTDTTAISLAVLSALSDVAEVLNDGERKVFLLRACDGLSFPQIATVTGLTADAARWRYNAAVKKLAARDADHAQDPTWLPVLALLRPLAERSSRVPADAGFLSSPVAACLVALSVVVAVTPSPAPRAAPADVRAPSGVATEGTTAELTANGTSRPAPTGSARAPHPLAAAPAVTGTPTDTPPPSDGVRACALVVCVGPTTNPGGPTVYGDRLVVPAARREVEQRVTPVCWAVPSQQQLVTCRPGDRGTYLFEPPARPQDDPRRSANFRPSTPRPGEPAKGTPS